MPRSRDFSGLWIPLITPFTGEGVDHLTLTHLVKHYVAAGISGFVACGSTGEAAALDKAEHLAVLDTVLAAAGSLPVVMGLSGYHMGHTLAWVRELAQHPIAGLLVPPPHYIRPAQAGVLQWFSTLADASDKPIIIYDIPARTGAPIALETLLTLADHPNISAIKDCGGDASKTQALIFDGRLQVLVGEDAQIFHTLSLGGAGAITASAHFCTPQFAQTIDLLRHGELQQARAVWQPLVEVVSAVFAEPNPAVIKAALAQQGFIRDGLRLPMVAASAGATQRLLGAIERVASA